MAFDGFRKNSAPPIAQTPFGTPPSLPSAPNPNPFDQKSPTAAAVLQQQPPQHKRLGTHTDMQFEKGTAERSKRTRSSSLAFESNRFVKNLNSSHEEAQRPDESPLRLASQGKSLVNIDNSPPHQRFRPVDYSDIYDAGTLSPPKPAYFNSPQRAKSPLLPYANVSLGTSSVQLDPERPDVSPLRLASEKKSRVNIANSPPHQRFLPVDYSDIYDAGTLSPPKSTYFNAPQRVRSPPLSSANVSLGTSSSQHDSEREMKAKAKRLARFNVELSQSMENLNDVTRHKSSGARRNQVPSEKRNADDAGEEAQDLVSGGILSDYEGLESSLVVVGLCPDMCPEPEREERERKGDLDKYERLDGERNQTSKFLAVKKYSRTAEREADLIRPMLVLQKTVDYLLQLLDQPYNDNFLGIYNFLWDRMRATRMDLRMQHIFNREAIIMLEQMIRLHIIAMHELCEYKKGEGFSEGFDAHLNIEQMNKTSVELFQMYNDHRKKGNSMQTEKEFRGYYALLKLDKHPGYKVEPAELSHDLAKMTHEIRCTPELLLARDVARACRIGNYIAFFRLARKATYLQACLMHAHFAKARTQALASLHSGLQNNQGIPISHVVKWLGMEGEDIESLLEHHGFVVKKFEERYMVKEGPFLNIDTDFLTKCSQLVHAKKSRRIIDDVYSGQTLSEVSVKDIVSDIVDQRTDTSNTVAWANHDVEMLDYKVDSVLRVVAPTHQLVEGPPPAIPNRENEDEITKGSVPGPSCVYVDDTLSNRPQQVDNGLVFESDGDVFMDGRTLPNLEGSIIQVGLPGGSNSNRMIENFDPQAVVGRSLDNEALIFKPNQDEASCKKLKLILRKWKQQSSMWREIREQREFLTNAALTSLSLGPPIRQIKAHPRRASEELNIDYFSRERFRRQEKLWSGLNVSELVAPVLSARNPDARCICWKLLIFVQANSTESQTNQLASRWLLSKLRGKESDDGLIVSLPRLSIWKKWISIHITDPQTCCLSVIREAMFDNNQPVFEHDTIAGTSCIMFVVSETIPWEIQRVRLHNLVMAVPSGSRLPLLVVSIDTCKEEIIDSTAAIINRLGLHYADRTRISSFSVVFVTGDSPFGQLNGFFNEDQLRECLQWLANHSPLQPAVHIVKTRELVLRYSMVLLNSLNISEVGPEHCISAFNEALDRLAEEIITAASVNPNHCPCPEIDLLEDSSNERKLADMSLPSVGWSSAVRIEPLIRAIKGCKLPSFPSNAPWLNQGSHLGSLIQNQKSAIEECLISYLIQSSRLLNADLAASEASVMLQKGAVLELCGSCYHIVPRWLAIFRRIYNWRLMKLTGGEFSAAYVLEQTVGPVAMELPSGNGAVTSLKLDTGIKDLKDSFGFEEHQPLHSVQTALSLDEMIEVSCSVPLAPRQPPLVSSPVHPAPEIVHEGGCVSRTDDACQEGDEDPRYSSNSAGDIFPLVERNKERLVAPLREKNDRLAVLLEQCNQLQDMIDEKLALYF